MSRFVVAAAIAGVAAANLHDRAYYEAKFFDWLQAHKKTAKDGSDFIHMLQNFADNDDLIEAHNAGNSSFKMGHNEFSHMTNAEWAQYMRFGFNNKPQQKASSIHSAPADVSSMASSVDWVSAGAVTAVKNQGSCGSCWAFSAIGAMEGAYLIKYDTQNANTWTGLSEQQLVSCDYGILKNLGCNGGLMDKAFDWIGDNNGICSEADYGYTSGTTGETGTCKTTCKNVANTDVKTYTDVQTNSDSALMSALNQQPVSVAIQANQPAFQFYKSGVITENCGTNLDHGVLAVGYGTYTDGSDYYKVKNSWGTSWGMEGYVLIGRNVAQSGGMCGILMGPPSYPTLA